MNEMGFASKHKNDAQFAILRKMVVTLLFVPIKVLDAAVEKLGDD